MHSIDGFSIRNVWPFCGHHAKRSFNSHPSGKTWGWTHTVLWLARLDLKYPPCHGESLSPEIDTDDNQRVKWISWFSVARIAQEA
jgi:hypothetical protein